jgi:hypothetical protein
MTARAVEQASLELRDLRREEWGDGSLAVIAFALALGATAARPDLALPLFLGGVFVVCRAAVIGWRRWDLLERLVCERDAYTIAAVRAHGAQFASLESRRALSSSIHWRLELAENPRIAVAADELTELAAELLDPELDLDPVCAAACSRLLTDSETSPLINRQLPLQDVRSQVFQIRAGFRPRA